MSSLAKVPQPQSYEKMIRSRRATERMIRRLQVVREQLDREGEAEKRVPQSQIGWNHSRPV